MMQEPKTYNELEEEFQAHLTKDVVNIYCDSLKDYSERLYNFTFAGFTFVDYVKNSDNEYIKLRDTTKPQDLNIHLNK